MFSNEVKLARVAKSFSKVILSKGRRMIEHRINAFKNIAIIDNCFSWILKNIFFYENMILGSVSGNWNWGVNCKTSLVRKLEANRLSLLCKQCWVKSWPESHQPTNQSKIKPNVTGREVEITWVGPGGAQNGSSQHQRAACPHPLLVVAVFYSVSWMSPIVEKSQQISWIDYSYLVTLHPTAGWLLRTDGNNMQVSAVLPESSVTADLLPTGWGLTVAGGGWRVPRQWPDWAAAPAGWGREAEEELPTNREESRHSTVRAFAARTRPPGHVGSIIMKPNTNQVILRNYIKQDCSRLLVHCNLKIMQRTGL